MILMLASVCMYVCMFLVCNISFIFANQFKEINFGDQSFTRSGELL